MPGWAIRRARSSPSFRAFRRPTSYCHWPTAPSASLGFAASCDLIVSRHYFYNVSALHSQSDSIHLQVNQEVKM